MVQASKDSAANPIAQQINVQTLPAKGLPIEIRLDNAARSALAQFNDLVSIDDFAADLVITRWQRDGVRVRGDIQAQLEQRCTVTLEPVSQYLETDIDAVFVASGSRLHKTLQSGEAHEILVDPEGDDVPEPFDYPFLDVGDVVQEFFALAIDPWPRAPGVALGDVKSALSSQPEASLDERKPFAGLSALKDKL